MNAAKQQYDRERYLRNKDKVIAQLNNDPENLVVLCRPCHVRVHSRWGLREVAPPR